jgi:hypothetical protein
LARQRDGNKKAQRAPQALRDFLAKVSLIAGSRHFSHKAEISLSLILLGIPVYLLRLRKGGLRDRAVV